MHSLPHSKNDCQWGNNNSSPFIMGNLSTMRRLLAICEVTTVFIVKNAQCFLQAALQIIYVITVREAVVGISLANLPRKAANYVFIDDSNQVPLRLPKM
jgi:hypothetical protein